MNSNTFYLQCIEMFPNLQPAVIYDVVAAHKDDHDAIFDQLMKLAETAPASPPIPSAGKTSGFQQPQYAPAQTTRQQPAAAAPSAQRTQQQSLAAQQPPLYGGPIHSEPYRPPPGYPAPAPSSAAQPGAVTTAQTQGSQWGAQPSGPQRPPTSASAPPPGYPSSNPSPASSAPAYGPPQPTASAMQARRQVDELLHRPVKVPVGGKSSPQSPPTAASLRGPTAEEQEEERKRAEECERLNARLAALAVQQARAVAHTPPAAPEAPPQTKAPKLPPGFQSNPPPVAASAAPPKSAAPPAPPPPPQSQSLDEEEFDSCSDEERKKEEDSGWFFGLFGKKKKKKKDKPKGERDKGAPGAAPQAAAVVAHTPSGAPIAVAASSGQPKPAAPHNAPQSGKAATAPPVSPASQSPAANVRTIQFSEAPPPAPVQPRVTGEGEFRFTESRVEEGTSRKFDTVFGAYMASPEVLAASATRRREAREAEQQANAAAPAYTFTVAARNAPPRTPAAGSQAVAGSPGYQPVTPQASPVGNMYAPGVDPLQSLLGEEAKPRTNARIGTASLDALLANFQEG